MDERLSKAKVSELTARNLLHIIEGYAGLKYDMSTDEELGQYCLCAHVIHAGFNFHLNSQHLHMIVCMCMLNPACGWRGLQMRVGSTVGVYVSMHCFFFFYNKKCRIHKI